MAIKVTIEKNNNTYTDEIKINGLDKNIILPVNQYIQHDFNHHNITHHNFINFYYDMRGIPVTFFFYKNYSDPQNPTENSNLINDLMNNYTWSLGSDYSDSELINAFSSQLYRSETILENDVFILPKTVKEILIQNNFGKWETYSINE